MNEVAVRIITLEPMQVASAYGFGPQPELEAWAGILRWHHTRPADIRESARFFGFNNPDPAPGSPNYGYEQMVTLEADETVPEPLKRKNFTGGRYAVTRCRNLNVIGEVWKKLVQWRESNGYQCGNHQWLEECLTPPGTPPELMEFDLYLPLA